MASFDSSLYDTIPQTTAGGIVALVRATLVASKGLGYAPAGKALKRLRQKGELLRSLHAAVETKDEKVDKRGVDLAMDRAWQAFERRATDYIELGPEFASDQAEAAEMHRVLFPNGMAFLALPYPEQWAEGEAILHRIAERELEGAIARFVGAPFLAQVRARHATYGEALGITKPKPSVVEEATMVEPLRETRAALATYARVLVAAVENEDLDPKMAQAALAPIAELRAQARGTKKKDAKPVEEAPSPEPLPPVD
jgi:hypothetical protein